jgi:DNA-binding NtrC family response regulator
MKARVLIVDDEPRMASTIKVALERSGYECECAASGAEALRSLEAQRPDVVISDRRMPGMDGLELLREVKARHGDLPFVIITAYADVPSAVEAMRAGAFDYVAKPFDNDEIRAQVARAVEVTRLKRENAWLRQEVATQFRPESMIAESAASRALLDLVRRVAPATSGVLIQGESGTGKEFVARLLHYWSDRVGAPFVAVNCAALAPGVLESELFGHERGAFTGAHQARAGCFERAHGGTLFLDEIGEISGEFQAKLLRVLQDGEVQRVGAARPRHVDVRVVAATNRNLREAVAKGRFREDLYFRLDVIPIHLEPLRARREDILPLARFFLERHRERPLALSSDAEAHLLAHDWPGNVRELENAIERAAILARGAEIGPEDLLLEPSAGRAESRASAGSAASGAMPPQRTVRARAAHGTEVGGVDGAEPDPERAAVDETARGAATSARGASLEPRGGTLQEAVDRATEERVRAALLETGGRRAEAARVLGVERTTLYRLMKRFGVDGQP